MLWTYIFRRSSNGAPFNWLISPIVPILFSMSLQVSSTRVSFVSFFFHWSDSFDLLCHIWQPSIDKGYGIFYLNQGSKNRHWKVDNGPSNYKIWSVAMSVCAIAAKPWKFQSYANRWATSLPAMHILVYVSLSTSTFVSYPSAYHTGIDICFLSISILSIVQGSFSSYKI